MKDKQPQKSLDQIFHEALSKQVEVWKSQGLTEQEIVKRIEANTEKAIRELVHTASEDYFSFFESHMTEIESKEKTNDIEFINHQEQIWGKCFAASRIMYVIAVEAAESYTKMVSEKDASEVGNKYYTFVALQHIHGRACQEFLEIFHLLRLGFADGAYARWRSMYELCCCGQFIVTYGEQIAKQFFEQSETDQWKYEWTRGAVTPDGKILNIPNFNVLQDNIQIKEEWKTQYRLACKVNHGSPQGTFKRLSNYGGRNLIPVGHSDYGLTMPAVDSATILTWISTLFLNVFPTCEFEAYCLLLDKWTKYLRALYADTEKTVFPEHKKPEEHVDEEIDE